MPQQIVSDNGPQFVSEEFSTFLKANGVRHTRCAPYHPASNGEAERFVRTFKESMKANKYANLSLSHRLQNFLLSYRSTPHSTTNMAPCELFLGRMVRTRFDLIKPDVSEQVMRQQERQKAAHDSHARFRELHIGQKVMVRNMRPGPTWIPGEIVQKLGPVTYLVDVFSDKPWKCHVDQLKERLDSQSSDTPLPGPRQIDDDDFDVDTSPAPAPDRTADAADGNDREARNPSQDPEVPRAPHQQYQLRKFLLTVLQGTIIH